MLKKDETSMVPYIMFGVLTIAYGESIYFFFPYSLLSLNYAMLLDIFFVILIGMIFGLVLLSLNVQRIMEIMLTHLFLVFEQSSMKKMILKNLTAHKMRN